MAVVVLAAQGVDTMFALELFDLKPGTFIKGIRIEDEKAKVDLWGRKAFLCVEGWKGTLANGMKEIRTPFYKVLGGVPNTFTSKNAIEFINRPDFESHLFFDDEIELGHMDWLGWKYGEPIGIHLGEFSIIKGSSDQSSNDVIVYSKLLSRNGETGYIVMNTPSLMHSELELI